MVKKTYGKYIGIASEGTEQKRIILDPVFGSRLELVYDSESKGSLPDVDTYVNVMHDDWRILEILSEGGGSVDIEEYTKRMLLQSTGKTPTKSHKETTTKSSPQEPIREVYGELIEITVSGDGQLRTGTITVKLHDMDLKIVVDMRTKGTFPLVGNKVIVTIADIETPKVINVKLAEHDGTKLPAYTPFPEREGAVRWPKACMSCGNIDFTSLKKQVDYWQKTPPVTASLKEARGKRKQETRKEIAKSIIKVGRGGVSINLVGAAFAALELSLSEENDNPDLYLFVTMYLCTSCYDKKAKFTKFMNIEILPSTMNLGFAFTSKEYADLFYDHNLGMIEADH